MPCGLQSGGSMCWQHSNQSSWPSTTVYAKQAHALTKTYLLSPPLPTQAYQDAARHGLYSIAACACAQPVSRMMQKAGSSKFCTQFMHNSMCSPHLACIHQALWALGIDEGLHAPETLEAAGINTNADGRRAGGLRLLPLAPPGGGELAVVRLLQIKGARHLQHAKEHL